MVNGQLNFLILLTESPFYVSVIEIIWFGKHAVYFVLVSFKIIYVYVLLEHFKREGSGNSEI